MKQILPDGRVQLSSPQCIFLFERLSSSVLLVSISGTDIGQFGPATLDEIRMEIGRNSPIELFIDARKALSASLEVSQEWTRFFTKNQNDLKRVHILVGSKFIELVVSIAQHLSRTGDLIRVYDNPSEFEKLLPAKPVLYS